MVSYNKFFTLLILVSVAASNIQAGDDKIIFVPQQFSSIQAAIDSVILGDTRIIVAPGVYRERINFGGKNIELVSTDPDELEIIQTTIIDANFQGAVVKFKGNETEEALLSGFTIRNGLTNKETDPGFCPGIDGGSPGSKARIEKNIIINNASELTITGTPPFQIIEGGFGGGIRFCNGVIRDNFITENFSQFGGAGIVSCNGIIERNFINANVAIGPGGGLFQCEGVIRDNPQIWLNISDTGGGGLDSCIGLIENNNIAFNISRNTGGGLNNCDGTVTRNLIHTNTGVLGGGGLAKCDGTIFKNRIAANGLFSEEETFEGGGLFNCRARIFNNFILSNTAQRGAGLSECHAPIVQNTILYNDAVSSGGGIFNCISLIKNNILWENTAPISPQIDATSSTPTFCLIQDWVTTGLNNISSPPVFLLPKPDNPTQGNYRLQKGSPGIDAGGRISFTSFTLDVDNEIRGHDGDGMGKNSNIGDGSDIDIGADEAFFDIDFLRQYIFGFYDWELTPELESFSDANNDGEININDLIRRLPEQN